MRIEDIMQVLREEEGLANVRCGGCLRIVMAKQSTGYWLGSFEHRCWDGVEEVEVEKVFLGGQVGSLITVRWKGGDI